MKHVHGTRRNLLAVTGAAGLAALGARRGLSALADSVYEKDVLANKPVTVPFTQAVGCFISDLVR